MLDFTISGKGGAGAVEGCWRNGGKPSSCVCVGDRVGRSWDLTLKLHVGCTVPVNVFLWYNLYLST